MARYLPHVLGVILSLLLSLLLNKIYTDKMLILDLHTKVDQIQREEASILKQSAPEYNPFAYLCDFYFDNLVENYEKLSKSLKNDLRISMNIDLGKGKSQESKENHQDFKEKLNLLKESTNKLSFEVKKTEENLNKYISEEKYSGDSETLFWASVGILVVLSLFIVVYMEYQWNGVQGLGIAMIFGLVWEALFME